MLVTVELSNVVSSVISVTVLISRVGGGVTVVQDCVAETVFRLERNCPWLDTETRAGCTEVRSLAVFAKTISEMLLGRLLVGRLVGPAFLLFNVSEMASIVDSVTTIVDAVSCSVVIVVRVTRLVTVCVLTVDCASLGAVTVHAFSRCMC